MPPTDLPRYRFGPLERRGIIGSLRKAQAALLGVGLVVGVIALRLAPNGINALLAGGALALTALVAFVPIQGRSLGSGPQWWRATCGAGLPVATRTAPQRPNWGHSRGSRPTQEPRLTRSWSSWSRRCPTSWTRSSGSPSRTAVARSGWPTTPRRIP